MRILGTIEYKLCDKCKGRGLVSAPDWRACETCRPHGAISGSGVLKYVNGKEEKCSHMEAKPILHKNSEITGIGPGNRQTTLNKHSVASMGENK